MNEDAEKLKGFLFKIIDEHKFACRKHPNFCNALIDPDSRVSWAESKSRIKARNAITNEYADNILMEEMAEAFAVYQHGDKAQALQKFAQCGAVILRIMQFVRDEIKGCKKITNLEKFYPGVKLNAFRLGGSSLAHQPDGTNSCIDCMECPAFDYCHDVIDKTCIDTFEAWLLKEADV